MAALLLAEVASVRVDEAAHRAPASAVDEAAAHSATASFGELPDDVLRVIWAIRCAMARGCRREDPARRPPRHPSRGRRPVGPADAGRRHRLLQHAGLMVPDELLSEDAAEQVLSFGSVELEGDDV